jgi:uncharacterized membrane protein
LTSGTDRGDDTPTVADSQKRAEDDVVGEARWPMASAVLAAMALTILLPDSVRLGPKWLLPLIEGVLLVAVIASDPGKINRRTRWLRTLSIVLVAVLVLGALWATVQLIDDLIHGGAVTNSASDLLEAGTIVWVSNNIAFALLYWELDGGGAAARAHHLGTRHDFAFPQQLNPRIGDPGWRPRFIDYLYLGFTNATAFSPTDTLPLSRWAKLTMMAESTVSFVTVALIVARAVNVLS